MDIQVTTSPNPFVRTYYSDVPLSESWQMHYFRAPLPNFLPDKDIRQFRLIGAKGERLVRLLCLIPGVSEVFLDNDHVSVIIRENGNLRWETLDPQIADAFQPVFLEECVRFVPGTRVETHVGVSETL